MGGMSEFAVDELSSEVHVAGTWWCSQCMDTFSVNDLLSWQRGTVSPWQ